MIEAVNVSRRRRLRQITGVAGLLGLALIVIARAAAPSRMRRQPGQYPRQLPLEPVEFAGPWWKRHRSWLTSPSPFARTSYVVVNARTGAAHAWRFRGNRRGRGWFGVRTRWVWTHPEWKADPWVVFYNPPPGR
jgi:hypothetical protein